MLTTYFWTTAFYVVGFLSATSLAAELLVKRLTFGELLRLAIYTSAICFTIGRLLAH